MKTTTFEELNLSLNMKRAVTDLGFSEATPIQTEAIPVLLKGRDIIGQARTGSGKTAAFAIPIIERIDLTNKNLQALVICPTRELAIQVTEEFRKLFKYYYGLAVATVYGGQEINRQLAALTRRPQIIVGTPGRLMDHMRRGTIKLDTIRFVVLDEADEMLNMGFRKDMETILGQTPRNRQTAMFSATMNRDIMRLMNQYQNNPVHIDTTDHKMEIPKIEQKYCDMLETEKHDALLNIIDQNEIKIALVFSNTKSRVDRIVRKLNNEGYPAEGIHGGHDQNRRERVMKSFRTGVVNILVATDVAGRGIDINNIDAVINYDLPRDDEDYTHRIGRTGRAGKTGKSFTFVVGEQVYDLMRIEKAGNFNIERIAVPVSAPGTTRAAQIERRPETTSYNDNFRPAQRPRTSNRPAERSTGYTAERPTFRTIDRSATDRTNERPYAERPTTGSIDRTPARPYNNNRGTGNSRPSSSAPRPSFDNNRRQHSAPAEVWITDSTGFRYKVID